MKQTKPKAAYLITALILVVGLFHLFVPRAEYKQWRDDANLFINHARNISEGVPYAELNFIPNPNLNISPRTFPPVFPMLISPVYKFRGIDRTAMKAVVAVFFTASLVLMVLAFARSLSTASLALLVAAVGLNPFVWAYAEMIISDIPFLFFSFLSLIVIEKASDAGNSGRRRVLLALAAGITAYLSYGTRSVGIILVPTILAVDYIKNRKLTGLTGISAPVFFILAYAQSAYIGSASGYTSIFTFEASSIPLAFFLTAEYIRKFSYLWENGYARALASAASIFFFLFALSGFIRKARAGVSVFELFAPLYLIIVVVYSAVTPTGSNPRYLIPLVPLYFYYAFYGIEHNGLLGKKGARRKVLAAAGIIIAASYIGAYSKEEIRPVTPVEEVKETVELFDFIRNETGTESVVVSRIPRSIALYTSRKTAFYHAAPEDSGLWDFFKDIKATHLVVDRLHDSRYIIDFTERNRDRLDPVFSNPDFSVFALRAPAGKQER